MALTCSTCGQTFKTTAEVADHIAETNQGIQGELGVVGTEKLTEEDIEQEIDAITGFSHVNYINERGHVIRVADLYPLRMAGPKMCFECNDQFRNNYRLWEHIIHEGHAKNINNGIYWHDALRDKKEADEFERKYFCFTIYFYYRLNR